MREIEVVRAEEIMSALSLSKRQVQNLFNKIAKKGSMIRLKRGIYLFPKKIPPGGSWQPDSLYLISHFMEVYDANYYISGLYVFNYYGLSEQIPSVYTIYNDKISGKRMLGKLRIELIKTDKSRIIGVNKIMLQDKQRQVNIASLPRTIFDAINDWDRFGTLPVAFEWINVIVDKKNDMDEFVNFALKLGTIITRRRIGYYMATYYNCFRQANKIIKKLKPTNKFILLDPTGVSSGKMDKSWGIIDNVRS